MKQIETTFSNKFPVREKKSDQKADDHGFFSPVFAPLLKDRFHAIILAGVLIIHFTMTGTGLIGWQCPINSTLGINCPGCGLTRATNLLLQGELFGAIRVHAFAPVFTLGLTLTIIIGILPDSMRTRSINYISVIERKTSFVQVIIICLIVYWIIRILGVIPFNT